MVFRKRSVSRKIWTFAIASICTVGVSQFHLQSRRMLASAPVPIQRSRPAGGSPEARVQAKVEQNVLEFNAVSIKRQLERPRVAGLACHGTDGVRRAPVGLAYEMTPPLGRCVGVGIGIKDVIGFAYGIPVTFVVGGPDWARSFGQSGFGAKESYEIETTAEDPKQATLDQLAQMLRAMLINRFKLKVHREVRESPGYSIMVSKNGVKLRETDEVEETGPKLNDMGQLIIKGKSRLDKLAQSLAPLIHSPVVDETGLPGNYDYELVWTPVGQRELLSELAASRLLEDQMGLRLQPRKVPINTVVIDYIEVPSAN